jgi:hypothetical protein
MRLMAAGAIAAIGLTIIAAIPGAGAPQSLSPHAPLSAAQLAERANYWARKRGLEFGIPQHAWEKGAGRCPHVVRGPIRSAVAGLCLDRDRPAADAEQLSQFRGNLHRTATDLVGGKSGRRGLRSGYGQPDVRWCRRRRSIPAGRRRRAALMATLAIALAAAELGCSSNSDHPILAQSSQTVTAVSATYPSGSGVDVIGLPAPLGTIWIR